jgi:hypothetical protein
MYITHTFAAACMLEGDVIWGYKKIEGKIEFENLGKHCLKNVTPFFCSALLGSGF